MKIKIEFYTSGSNEKQTFKFLPFTIISHWLS